MTVNNTGRKNLPLPISTDTDVIRANYDTLTTYADTTTQYNANEVISGKWEYQNVIVTDAGIGIYMKNNTSGIRNQGDVVMLDPNNDNAFVTPATPGITSGANVYVVAETIAPGSTGRVTDSGTTYVSISGVVTRGQYLYAQNGLYTASASPVLNAGAFAYTIMNPNGSSQCMATMNNINTIPSIVSFSIPANSLEFLGNIGIGAVPLSYVQALLAGTINSTGLGVNGLAIQSTLVASVNNEQLTALILNPVFNDNGHTGVTHYGLYSLGGANYFAGNVTVQGAWALNGGAGSFFGAPAANRQIVTGSRSSGVAFTSLLTGLVNLGLLQDQTTP